MSDQYHRATAAQRESWDLAQYALRHNRALLMERFNKLVGSPSYAMAVVQDEFISGRMEADEMIDYARACREIIFSIEITSLPGADAAG
jgi:hypothetical protein